MSSKDLLVHFAVIAHIEKSSRLLIELGLIEGPFTKYVKKYIKANPELNEYLASEEALSDLTTTKEKPKWKPRW